MPTADLARLRILWLWASFLMPTLLPAAVLFDAGMTLLHPREPVSKTYVRVAAELGVTCDPAALERQLLACWKKVSSSGRDDPADQHLSSEEIEAGLWRRFTAMVAEPFPGLRARHADWLAKLVEHFDDPGQWECDPHAQPLLNELRAREVVVGVVSNWHQRLHRILRERGLRDLVDFVLISSEVGYRKPHRAIFEKALGLAERPPDETWHVGDSLREDVRGARAVGLKTILLTRSAGLEEEMDATALCGDLAEVRRHFFE